MNKNRVNILVINLETYEPKKIPLSLRLELGTGKRVKKESIFPAIMKTPNVSLSRLVPNGYQLVDAYMTPLAKAHTGENKGQVLFAAKYIFGRAEVAHPAPEFQKIRQEVLRSFEIITAAREWEFLAYQKPFLDEGGQSVPNRFTWDLHCTECPASSELKTFARIEENSVQLVSAKMQTIPKVSKLRRKVA